MSATATASLGPAPKAKRPKGESDEKPVAQKEIQPTG